MMQSQMEKLGQALKEQAQGKEPAEEGPKPNRQQRRHAERERRRMKAKKARRTHEGRRTGVCLLRPRGKR